MFWCVVIYCGFDAGWVDCGFCFYGLVCRVWVSGWLVWLLTFNSVVHFRFRLRALGSLCLVMLAGFWFGSLGFMCLWYLVWCFLVVGLTCVLCWFVSGFWACLRLLGCGCSCCLFLQFVCLTIWWCLLVIVLFPGFRGG